MLNPIKYSRAPFSAVLLHGGPGAAGEMTPVALELSQHVGVLEPLQTKHTIGEQVQELHDILISNTDVPVYLVGYSWGAWLGWIFAATHPELVKKLILVSSGPFETKYVQQMNDTRAARFSEEDKKKLAELQKLFESPDIKNKDPLFEEFGAIFSKADSYSPLKHDSADMKIDFDIYNSIWPEAAELRKGGKLLEYADKITCPVVAIHGDYDPHPWQGIKESLEKRLKDFKFHLLEKCGHTPWYETHARDNFYYLLLDQLH